MFGMVEHRELGVGEGEGDVVSRGPDGSNDGHGLDAAVELRPCEQLELRAADPVQHGAARGRRRGPLALRRLLAEGVGLERGAPGEEQVGGPVRAEQMRARY